MTTVTSRITTASAPADRLLTVVVWGFVALVLVVFVAGTIAGVVLGAAATPVVLFAWDPVAVEAVLTGWGLPAGSIVAYGLLLDLTLFGLGLVATWVLLRRPWTGFRVYVALVLLLHVTVGGNAPLLLAAAVPALDWATALAGLGWFGLFSLLMVFPDGKFVPHWTRWTVPAWVAVFAWFLTLPAEAGPPTAAAVALLILLVGGVVAQIVRYRGADPGSRRQTRWVLAALAARAGLVALVGLSQLTMPQSGPTPAALVIELAGLGLSYLVSAFLVLAIALAVVRHRLFDTDGLVGRAVVYAALTAFVLVVYGVVVGLVGLLWPGGGVILPVLATAAAAVSLVPLRSWLQHHVTRLVYGDRSAPNRVIGELGDRLAATVRPEDLVQTVVATVGPALGLERAAIVLAGAPAPAARYVDDAAPATDRVGETFPVQHHGRTVGRLEVVPGRTASLTPEVRDLLRRVADHAGLAVATASASAELRLAREQAVAAREEERRRLHRDLHDGLGPTLASLSQRIDVAADLLETDPGASRRLLEDAGEQVRESVGEVRRLVYALRPPRLDDLGLVEALRLACDELSPGRPSIEVLCVEPLPDLPAVVETTAYRIVLEAATNVVRHAQADHCVVGLAVDDRELVVTVSDDGVGLPEVIDPGAGLRSLRERAAEVGGTLALSGHHPRGTTVTARLPLTSSAAP